MEARPYTTRKGAQQFRPVLTEEEFREEAEAYTGFCLACGAEASQCEPDARRYTCRECNAPKVYGLEELLVMGLIIITAEE